MLPGWLQPIRWDLDGGVGRASLGPGRLTDSSQRQGTVGRPEAIQMTGMTTGEPGATAEGIP